MAPAAAAKRRPSGSAIRSTIATAKAARNLPRGEAPVTALGRAREDEEMAPQCGGRRRGRLGFIPTSFIGRPSRQRSAPLTAHRQQSVRACVRVPGTWPREIAGDRGQGRLREIVGCARVARAGGVDHLAAGDGQRGLLEHGAVGREEHRAFLPERHEHRLGAARLQRASGRQHLMARARASWGGGWVIAGDRGRSREIEGG